MPRYKLYYFPAKGRAEHIRLIFVQAGVDFEDVKIPFDEWKNMKDGSCSTFASISFTNQQQ